jgi:SNF2 Helicase protein/SNF2-related domain
MIVFHAGFLNGQLCIWGESPISDVPVTARKRKRTDSITQSQITNPFPYDAGSDRLLSALGEFVAGLRLSKRDTEISAIWVPTMNGQPVASSPLIAELSTSFDKAALKPWAVTIIPLRPVEGLDLLSACVGRETLGQGAIIGRDLAFWASAMRFAGALVARQQFLPGIQIVKEAYLAQWKPVFTGADAQRLPRLAQAMPQACRALANLDSPVPPDTPALSILNSFLIQMVDCLVRSGNGAAGRVSFPSRSKRANFESIHDQWLHALCEADGLMDCPGSELALFTEQLREWQRPIDVSVATPFRLCFRLEEPDEETRGEGDKGTRGQGETGPLSLSPCLPVSPSSSWFVRYLLQAADDPSLLIPVADAWSAKGRAATLLRRSAFDPREYLLSSLGQAARFSPQIEQSLKSATPSGFDLDSVHAHEFLTEKAWLLEQAGFGIMLPAWWTRKGTKLRLSMRANVKSPKMQGGSGLSLDQIVKFDWEVALGDQTLSLRELEALAKLKSPLVKVRGQWVELNADEIHAALDFWKKKAADQATLRDVVQMALGSANTPGGIAFEGVTASGWISDFLGQLEGRRAFEEISVSNLFQGTLRPYQERGYSWLAFLRRWGLGSCLADDMGLGKTLQALALIQHLWQNDSRRPALVVCPTSVIGNWQKEAARFTPDLPVLVHHGVTRKKDESFRRETAKQAIVISSYSLLQRDFEILKEVDWSAVILDEAQNIKNPETNRAAASR